MRHSSSTGRVHIPLPSISGVRFLAKPCHGRGFDLRERWAPGESLNDVPLGKYDVTVHIILFESDKEIAWDLGPDVPVPHFYGYRLDTGEDGVTNVTSYYDWSKVTGDLKERFPIVPESALRATLGILERTVRKGL